MGLDQTKYLKLISVNIINQLTVALKKLKRQFYLKGLNQTCAF